MTLNRWLPCEDSNSVLLVQSQVRFRLHHSASLAVEGHRAEGGRIERPLPYGRPRVSGPAHYLSASLPYPRRPLRTSSRVLPRLEETGEVPAGGGGSSIPGAALVPSSRACAPYQTPSDLASLGHLPRSPSDRGRTYRVERSRRLPESNRVLLLCRQPPNHQAQAPAEGEGVEPDPFQARSRGPDTAYGATAQVRSETTLATSQNTGHGTVRDSRPNRARIARGK